MGRALFVVSIAVGATLLTSFVAFVGMLWTDGEDREGTGLLWIFTLPGTLLVSLLGAFAYRRYVKASGLDAARWYTLLVVAVSVVGPVAGYFLMPLLAWL